MKDTSTLPIDNVFRGKPDTDAVLMEIIKDLNWIRSSIDNVPGNSFIAQDDRYAIIARISSYMDNLSAQMMLFLSLPEQE